MTLRELTTLIKEVNDASRRRDAKISFALVYPDKRGEPVVRQVIDVDMDDWIYIYIYTFGSPPGTPPITSFGHSDICGSLHECGVSVSRYRRVDRMNTVSGGEGFLIEKD